MSDSPETRSPRAFAWRSPLGCTAIFAVVLLIALVPAYNIMNRGPAHGHAKARVAVQSVKAALNQYRSEYGAFPPSEN
ncbi:MAG TPA: hypothetical protein VK961_09190, partial [Chthoniobacter sp.]|nr:hypothetical protein [Chthoniobacter sp.]